MAFITELEQITKICMKKHKTPNSKAILGKKNEARVATLRGSSHYKAAVVKPLCTGMKTNTQINGTE